MAPVSYPRASNAPLTQPPCATPLRCISARDEVSFKTIGAELCLASDEFGEVWIVPEYTGASRNELSIEHAAIIAAVVTAFPGARVTAFKRRDRPIRLTEEK